MKVAIFENQYDEVKFAFETANLIDFNNQLKFEVFPSSQSADNVDINHFDVIFIDIDLSVKSLADGYSVIRKIIDVNEENISKIIILTGNNKIKESLVAKDISPTLLQILIKPTDYVQIANSIKKVLRGNTEQ